MVDYGYDTQSIAYFTGKGMNVIRLAFLWERVQTAPLAFLNEVELQRIDDFVKAANEQGASVILDVQNFARYQQSQEIPLPIPSPAPDIVGSPALPAAALADLWSKLATHYAANQRVIFGLMNEPYDMPTMQWVNAANDAVTAIRLAGADNLVLVPGNNWSHGYGWGVASEGETDGVANSVGMALIEDTGDNYLIEIHQYFHDEDSPDKNSCVSPTAGTEALAGVTGWLRANDRRGFLGELGTGSGEVCLAALDDALSYVEDNRDVWVGWAYFSGGRGLEDEDMTIQPGPDGADKPQMEVLLHHMAPPGRAP
jgi:endoglucanase